MFIFLFIFQVYSWLCPQIQTEMSLYDGIDNKEGGDTASDVVCKYSSSVVVSYLLFTPLAKANTLSPVNIIECSNKYTSGLE